MIFAGILLVLSSAHAKSYVWSKQNLNDGTSINNSLVSCGDSGKNCCVGYAKDQETGKESLVRCWAENGACPANPKDCLDKFQKQLEGIEAAAFSNATCETVDGVCSSAAEFPTSNTCEQNRTKRRVELACDVNAESEADACVESWSKSLLITSSIYGEQPSTDKLSCESCNKISAASGKRDQCNSDALKKAKDLASRFQGAFDINADGSVAQCLFVKPVPDSNSFKDANRVRCNNVCNQNFYPSHALQQQCQNYAQLILGRFKGVYANGQENDAKINVLPAALERARSTNNYTPVEFWIKYHVANEKNGALDSFVNGSINKSGNTENNVKWFFQSEVKRYSQGPNANFLVVDSHLTSEGKEMMLRCNHYLNTTKIKGDHRKMCTDWIIGAKSS